MSKNERVRGRGRPKKKWIVRRDMRECRVTMRKRFVVTDVEGVEN